MSAPLAPSTAHPPAPASPPPLQTTAPMTLTVLRARLRATWNSIQRSPGGRRRITRTVIFTLIAIFLIGPIFAGIVVLLQYDAANEPLEAMRYPPAIFAVTALALLFMNFPATLNALYFSPTLPLLLAAPVPFRTVFTVTLIEGALAAPLVLGLATLALVAYGLGIGAGIAYYVVALVGLVATAVFVTALTQILVTATLRVIPAQRAREGLTLLGAIITVGAYGLYYSSRLANGQASAGPNALRGIVDRINPIARVIPPGWAGFAATAAQSGDTLSLAAWLGALLAATAAIVALTLNVFRHAYLIGYSATRTGSSHRAAREGQSGVLDRLGAGWSPQVRAVATKELRTLVRDTRRLSILVRSGGFALVYLFVFVIGGNRGNGRGLSVGAGAADFWFRSLFVAFVVGGIASGVSAYTFGAEGQQFVFYRLAPITARTLILAKWLAGLLFTIPIGFVLAFAVGAFLGGAPGQILVLVLFVLWYAIGSTLNAVATAAIGAQFNQSRADRSTSVSGTLVRLTVSVLFFLGSLLFWGALVFPNTATIPGMGDTAGDLGSLRAIAAGIGLLLALGGLTLALTVGSARLTQLLRPLEVEDGRTAT